MVLLRHCHPHHLLLPPPLLRPNHPRNRQSAMRKIVNKFLFLLNIQLTFLVGDVFGGDPCDAGASVGDLRAPLTGFPPLPSSTEYGPR